MRVRLVALVAVAVALAGCGIGPGKDQGGGAELRVTRDFGERPLADAKKPEVREGDTVMRFLQAERKVTLRYGGGFVQSIDGLAGKGATGQSDWFYWVNGVEGSVGAADRKLHPGDVVQWDYRNWSATMSIPGIVGAYPEPFLHGIDGKKQPLRVECADPEAAVCRTVRDRLGDAGVIASGGTLGAAGRGQVARIFVGTWKDLREIRTLRGIEDGPEASGVFARFSDQGGQLDLLDPKGGVARTAAPGTGLVAATRVREEEGISFLVTGVDDQGVEAAAGALDRNKLRGAFAVAVNGSAVTRLPLGASGG